MKSTLEILSNKWVQATEEGFLAMEELFKETAKNLNNKETNLLLLQESHKRLLIVVMAYKEAHLDKIEETHPARVAIEEIINESIKTEKSVAETTDS